MKLKRWITLLLAAALLLPLCLSVLPNGTRAETIDDIFAAISAYEDEHFAASGMKNAKQAKESDYAALADGLCALVEQWNGYVEGSLVRNGSSFFWDGVDGTGYGYFPYLRQKLKGESATGKDAKKVSGVETVSFEARGGGPTAKNVAVFQPYHGLDSNFSGQYPDEGVSVAEATGGVCTVYYTDDATIDAIANALVSCAVVFFDSHGIVDKTPDPNTSYLCLNNGDGITSADMQTVSGANGSYKHAAYGGSSGSMQIYAVDGTAIANHMRGKAQNSCLWMAICLSMMTDGLCAPLRNKGVEVVYGYSQEVSFKADYEWEADFWTRMKAGDTVAEAAAYMKRNYVYDHYASDHAYPIFVSGEDAYPGQGHVDAEQTVQSAWTLTPRPLYGDANCDGRINSLDAALVLRALAGLDTLSAAGLLNAKVSGGAELSSYDAILILQYVVHRIDHFPVEE